MNTSAEHSDTPANTWEFLREAIPLDEAQEVSVRAVLAAAHAAGCREAVSRQGISVLAIGSRSMTPRMRWNCFSVT